MSALRLKRVIKDLFVLHLLSEAINAIDSTDRAGIKHPGTREQKNKH